MPLRILMYPLYYHLVPMHSSLFSGDNNRKQRYCLPQCTAVRLFINQSKFVKCTENEMLPVSFRYIFTDSLSYSSLIGYPYFLLCWYYCNTGACIWDISGQHTWIPTCSEFTSDKMQDPLFWEIFIWNL